MDLIDIVAIHHYHQGRIHRFGKDASRALGWKTPEGQSARFDVLCSIADMSHASVLDAGCGHGDLRAFLNEKFTGTRYLGIDQIEAFLDIAVEKYGHLPDTSFFSGDFSEAELPVTDYILACGALSYRNSDPGFAFRTIKKLFDSCRLGFAFNMLAKVESAEGILVSYNPQRVLTYCKSLTPDVELKEGYYEEDFTVMMRR